LPTLKNNHAVKAKPNIRAIRETMIEGRVRAMGQTVSKIMEKGFKFCGDVKGPGSIYCLREDNGLWPLNNLRYMADYQG
jgi:hypothetical protein